MENFYHPPVRHPAFYPFLLFLGCILCSFLCIQTVQAQLAGNYTIGGADGDYVTFSEAVSALEKEGVSGPVTFKVRPGIYEEQIDIGFPGNSCTNTVTFEGEASDREQVILQAPNNNSSYTVKVRRLVEGVQFRNMTIKGSQTLVETEEGTNCFSLENNLLMGESGSLVRAYSKINEKPSHHHQYQNNLFIGGSTGLVKVREQPYNSAPELEEGLLVIGNEFKGQSSCGISIGSQTTYRINDNRIDAGSCGISAAGSKNGKEVNGNIIQVAEGEWAVYFIGGAPKRFMQNQVSINIHEYGGSAIYIEGTYDSSDGEMVIANNLIKVSYNHPFNNFGWNGMSLTSTNANIYHNSIQLGPSYNTKGYVADWSYGTYRVFNNNFSNLSGKSVASPSAVAMDHNNLYSPEFDLEEWQNRTGFDKHSISVRPDEHTLHPALAGAGLYLEEVPTDLNGNPRPNPPSIGAIELDKKSQFTIGGEDGDFTSFTEMVSFLDSSYGLDSILVKVRPGIYREQLTITKNNFPHITFEGESGDSTKVVLEYPEGYALRINSANHFTFRYMTISGRGAVRIEALNDKPASHLTFENNMLKSSGDAPVLSTFSNAREGGFTHSVVDFLSIRNNYIEGRGWGIRKEGSIIHFTSHNVYRLSDVGLEISGNHLVTGKGGIFVSNTKDINIRNNKLEVETMSGSLEPVGIHIQNSHLLRTISENHLHIKGAGAKGLWLDGGAMGSYFGPNFPDELSGNKILLSDGGTGMFFNLIFGDDSRLMANNMVSVKGNNGSMGIFLKDSGIKAKIYFNSIFLYGNDTQSKVLSFLDAFLDEGSGNFVNNIFANSAGGFAIHGQKTSSNNSGSLNYSDYNVFYTNGEFLAHWYGEDVAGLNEWQSLMGTDANSLSVDPQFESAESLIPANPALDGAGNRLEAVTTDFFGKLRNNPPDIGAVEFETEEPSPAPEPTPGLVTGGGWFYSPSGAIVQNPFAEGKAFFAFKAEQKKKEKSPKGNAVLVIPQANFRFHSNEALEWMSVSENKAIFQGTGSLNRVEGYRFLISVVDHGNGPQVPNDTYRIIIWDSQGELVYDNQRGSDVYAQATMAIGSGNIIIRNEDEARQRLGAGQEVAAITRFNAYPTSLNQEELWLEVPAMEGVKELQLRILDMHGRLMAESTIRTTGMAAKESWQLNSKEWPSGVYILIIRSGSQFYQQKLVK